MRFLNNEILLIFKHVSCIPSWVNNPGFRLESIASVSYTNIPIWRNRASFCPFHERHSCVVTRPTNFRHFMAVGARYSLWEFSGKYKHLWTKKIHHVCWLIIGYLWAKYEDFEFLKHVPHFTDITRSSGTFSLKVLRSFLIYLLYFSAYDYTCVFKLMYCLIHKVLIGGGKLWKMLIIYATARSAENGEFARSIKIFPYLRKSKILRPQ